MHQAVALPLLTAESGLTVYFQKIPWVSLAGAAGGICVAKRWREHGDHTAAHKLVTSHFAKPRKCGHYL